HEAIAAAPAVALEEPLGEERRVRGDDELGSEAADALDQPLRVPALLQRPPGHRIRLELLAELDALGRERRRIVLPPLDRALAGHVRRGVQVQDLVSPARELAAELDLE